MKILIVSQCYYPDTFLINEIAPKMVKDGHEVTVLTGLPRDEEKHNEYRSKRIKRERIADVEIIRCYDSLNGNSTKKLIINYLSFVLSSCIKVFQLKNDYDVVFCYQLSPVTQAIPAVLYKKLHRRPLFLYCLDIFPESVLSHTSKEGMIYKIVGWISKKIYKACDVIGVTSKSFIDYHTEVNGIPRLKQVYIPQHADDSLLSLPIRNSKKGHIDFLFAGNIGYAQNLDVIVNAAEQIEDRYDFSVHIVGDGSKLNAIKDYVAEKHQEKRFVFHSRVPRNEMEQFYNESDVLLLTLRGNNRVGETLPGKLQTYMTAGRPIIASINGSAAEVIREANCGLCVPAGDAAGLAKAMMKYMDNPDDFWDCGTNARAFYAKNFTFDIFMHQLMEQLYRLADKESVN